jgi:hypothetical protein
MSDPTPILEMVELTLSPELAKFIAYLTYTFTFHLLGISLSIVCCLI